MKLTQGGTIEMQTGPAESRALTAEQAQALKDSGLAYEGNYKQGVAVFLDLVELEENDQPYSVCEKVRATGLSGTMQEIAHLVSLQRSIGEIVRHLQRETGNHFADELRALRERAEGTIAELPADPGPVLARALGSQFSGEEH